jgi:hypothetical protein
MNRHLQKQWRSIFYILEAITCLFQLEKIINHLFCALFHSRAAYVAGHDTVAVNLQLVKGYGFTPSDVTGGATHISGVDESQQAVTYTTHAVAAGSSVHGATSMA